MLVDPTVIIVTVVITLLVLILILVVLTWLGLIPKHVMGYQGYYYPKTIKARWI